MISKKRYIQAFGLCVIALAVVRAVFPSVADDTKANNIGVIKNDSTDSSTIVAEAKVEEKETSEDSEKNGSTGKDDEASDGKAKVGSDVKMTNGETPNVADETNVKTLMWRSHSVGQASCRQRVSSTLTDLWQSIAFIVCLISETLFQTKTTCSLRQLRNMV